MVTDPDHRRTIDELLDAAVHAISHGDQAGATALAQRVLAVDHGNPEAEDLLLAPAGGGELRRLTILFCDLVDSTVLSTRTDPEVYRTLVGRYREHVLRIVDRYGGHVSNTKGDGLLAVFGHPRPHEDDARRAVQAALDITREVARLGEQARRRFDVEVSVRAGVHRGLVYLDTAEDDVYGFAANLAARVSGLASPGTLVVSDAIEPLIRDAFELAATPAQPVKGIPGLVNHHQVLGERVAPAPIRLGPIVGRRHELSYLQRIWSQAEVGAPTTAGVALLGEPGIGKSRLVAAVEDMARRSGAAVLPLLGSPLHTNAGLHPIRMLIERRCGITRQTGDTERLRLVQAELHRRSLDPETAVPLLAPVLGIPAKGGYEPVKAEGNKLYQQIAAAVQEYLVACAAGRPGLIIAEDLHWFDTSTLEVLDALLESKLPRLLVLMTGRDDTKLPSVTGVELLDLRPLTDAEAVELILALNPQLSRRERAAVRRRCDGVPLYIEEVVSALRYAPTDESGRPQVPDRLYDPLFARLRTSKNTVPVAAAAATIGREVDRGLLVSVLDLNEIEIDDVIGELEDALILEPVSTDVWRFRHELLREVAYELAPPSLRRTLHGRVADALVDSSGNGVPEWRLAALHYDQATRFDEAATAYQQAATEARHRGALGEAHTCLSRSIAQVEQLPAGEQRDRRETALRLRRGFLTYATDGTSSEDAVADFERCLELCGSGVSDEFLATVGALYGYYATRADLRRAAQVVEVIGANIRQEWERIRPLSSAGLAMVAWYRGEFGSALAGLEAAAAAAGALDTGELETVWFMPNEAVASVYTHLAAARFTCGDYAGAEAAFEQTARRVQRLDFPQGPYSHAYLLFYEVWMRAEAGQLERAAELVTDLTEKAERHGFDYWVLIAALQQAAVNGLRSLARGEVDRGELDSQIETMEALVDTFRDLEVTVSLNIFDGVLARLLTAAARTEEARDVLNTALCFAEQTGVHFYDAELLRLRAHTQRDRDACEADIHAAVEVARGQGAVIFELRSAADDVAVRGRLAYPVLTEAVSHFPVASTWPELGRAQTLLR